jgi:hypothetical protein
LIDVETDVLRPVHFSVERRITRLTSVQAAFDSSTQLAVFHRGWTAGRDADAEGK